MISLMVHRETKQEIRQYHLRINPSFWITKLRLPNKSGDWIWRLRAELKFNKQTPAESLEKLGNYVLQKPNTGSER